jgi:hypothetical protein
MKFRSSWNFCLVLIFAKFLGSEPGSSSSCDNFFNSYWDENDIITRDICIIGGGSSGTYAALRLREMNQSVVIVERRSRLGGNTQTYTDPDTGLTVDYGVQFFHNTTIVTDYFASLNVPLAPIGISETGVVTEYVDFRTGKVVSGYSPGDPTMALETYGAQLANYPYLDSGFELPNPVPSDLVLPFGDFVTKYNISPGMSFLSGITEGIGDLLAVPTLYVMKLFGLNILEALQTGFLTTAAQDNSALYEKAQTLLLSADAVLLSSHIVATNRTNTGKGSLSQRRPG